MITPDPYLARKSESVQWSVDRCSHVCLLNLCFGVVSYDFYHVKSPRHYKMHQNTGINAYQYAEVNVNLTY